MVTIFLDFLEPEEPAYSLFRFGVESKNLLTKQPGYWEDFIRFPQKFRKLYGRELKVRNYGYEKLADLCEAVGEIVEASMKEYSLRILIKYDFINLIQRHYQVTRFVNQLNILCTIKSNQYEEQVRTL